METMEEASSWEDLSEENWTGYVVRSYKLDSDGSAVHLVLVRLQDWDLWTTMLLTV